MENFLNRGKTFVCQKNFSSGEFPWSWKNICLWENSLVMEKSLIEENFLDHGKISGCGKNPWLFKTSLNVGKVSTCGKNYWSSFPKMKCRVV